MPDLEALKKLTPSDISKLLENLSPEQLAAIRGKALAAGLPGADDKVQRTANGALKLQITLPPEVAEPLITWAEAADEAGEKLHQFLEKIIVDSTTAFVFQDWGGAERTTDAPKPAGGVPAGVPATSAT